MADIYRQEGEAMALAGRRPSSETLGEMSRTCTELADTFPSWRRSLVSLVPFFGVVLTLATTVVAAVGSNTATSYAVGVIVGATWFFWLGGITGFFASFRRKRELFYPAARTRAGRRSPDPPGSIDRNVYWCEEELFAALDRPRQREASIDHLTLYYSVCMAFVGLVAVYGRRLDVAEIWIAMIAALAVVGLVSRLQGSRRWR